MRLLLRRFPALGGLQLFALLCVAVIGIASANAATLIVTNTNDSGPGSLRQALAQANDGDTIQFDPALNGQTITLTSGELAIAKNITISGPGSNLLTVSRSSTAPAFRIFHATPNHTVLIARLTINGGNAAPNGSGILNDHATLMLESCSVQNNINPAQGGQGGGIFNDGSGTSASLTISNSTLSGNMTTMAGGGIFNDGSNAGSPTLTITDSLVTGNIAEFGSQGNGGGIYNNGATATLMITNSIVSNNRAGPVQEFLGGGVGGGIWSSGSAAINTSTINNNVAHAQGGGINNSGTLTITGSTVNNNASAGYNSSSPYAAGGGIENSGTLTITSTTLSGNFASLDGGGLYGNGSITNSTISGNQSYYGGGIYGSPTVTNSTISANRASLGSLSGSGGGIFGGGTIQHCTIAGNITDYGGGGIAVEGSLAIGNTILKTGTSGANIVILNGTVTSHGYNISNDNGGGFLTGPGDQINTDPMLGPLQENGGPTFTHELLTGSPAIDAGDPNFTPPPSTDQRGPGYARVFNGRIDIGSFEVQPTPPPITISGTISYCSNPVHGPVPNVVLTLTGSASGTMLSDGAGSYIFSSLASGGTYTVTPSKAAVTPGGTGANINTIDIVATQRHFLQIVLLSGCRLTAADVNGDNVVNTVDVVAIQRFYLGEASTANVGQYKFTPVSRTYPALVSNQTGQNYDALVLGDVAAPFVE